MWDMVGGLQRRGSRRVGTGMCYLQSIGGVGCLQGAYIVIVIRQAWELGLSSQGHEYGVVKSHSAGW